MNIWNQTAPEPEWVQKATDEDIAERFWREANGRHSHEQFGRMVRDIRKRLYLLVVRGIEHSGCAAPAERTRVEGEQKIETEICPVCKDVVPLDSLLSYNNVPNAFCQQCVDSGKV